MQDFSPKDLVHQILYFCNSENKIMSENLNNELIFRSDSIEVYFLNAQSNTLIITFAPLDHDVIKNGFWGRHFAQKVGYSAVGFVARQNNWYPRLAMQEAVFAIREILARFNSRITYGSSMGGYASLKYGALCKADASVAFGPQNTIDPSDSTASQSFFQYFRPDVHKNMEITSEDMSPRAYVFYDPHHKADRLSALAISDKGPWATLIRLPHMGHECIKVFAGSALMKEVFDRALVKDSSGLNFMARQHRASNPTRYVGIAGALIDRHPLTALKFFIQHQDKFNNKEIGDFYNRLSRAHSALGKYNTAEEYARNAIRAFPYRPTYIRDLANILERTGRAHEALNEYERYLQISPNDYVIQSVAARLYLEVGDLANAERAADAAISVPNKRASIRRRFAEIRTRQNRYLDALALLEEAIVLEPLDSQNHLQLALLLTSLGQEKKAAEIARQGCNLRTSSPDISAQLIMLSQRYDA